MKHEGNAKFSLLRRFRFIDSMIGLMKLEIIPEAAKHVHVWGTLILERAMSTQ
jgi:hypothetical protein